MSAYSDIRKPLYSDVGRFNTSVNGSGDNTIVAASAGRKIRVLEYMLSAASAVNAKWTSSTTSDLTKLHYFLASGVGPHAIIRPYSPFGHFETVAGELLGLNLSGAVVVTVSGLYILV